MERIVVIPL